MPVAKLLIKCKKCGVTTELFVDAKQFDDYSKGKLLVDAFPELTKEERTTLLTSVCQNCQRCPKDDEEDS